MLKSPERRLRDAERRFYDAYCRGGAARHRELVLPLDFFSRPPVREAILTWIRSGEEPVASDLESAWRDDASPEERVAFYENIARFFTLLADPRTHRVSWRGPDGRLLSHGSKIFD